jgi:hypothetical protein
MTSTEYDIDLPTKIKTTDDRYFKESNMTFGQFGGKLITTTKFIDLEVGSLEKRKLLFSYWKKCKSSVKERVEKIKPAWWHQPF